jgi:NAD(P)H dehydrogenase (quinone)
MIAVTAATGRLGQIVVQQLRDRHPDRSIVALARDPAKAVTTIAPGVEVRPFDYDRPEGMAAALDGVDELLLISGNAVGQRGRQHRAVIEAAKTAGVALIGYTSVLRASETTLAIAAEHRETETILAEIGVPYLLLRHGWYCENFLFRIHAAIESGKLPTCAGQGLISAATRDDFAEAAVAILTSPEDQAGRVYELAGSTSFTFDQMAAEASRVSGRVIEVVQMAPGELIEALIAMGIPEIGAGLITKSDIGAREGGLFDDSRTLGRIIRRPTTPISTVLEEAIA